MAKKKKYNFEQVVIDSNGNESAYEGSVQQKLDNNYKTVQAVKNNVSNSSNLNTLKKNRDIAQNNFDKANLLWQNKVVENRNNKTKQMLSYEDKDDNRTIKTEDINQNKKTGLDLVDDSNNAFNSASEEYQKKEQTRNKYALADYLYNKEKYSDENYKPGFIQSVYDKSIGRGLRGAGEMLLNFGGRDNEKYTDENGNVTYLPSELELKNQAVKKTYGNNIVGKVTSTLGDVTENAGKIAAATGLDAITLGTGGTIAYNNDMLQSAYKNAKNQGASDKQAVANATIETLAELATGKMLGSATKGLTKIGGNTLAETEAGSAFEKLLEKQIGKKVSNKTASKLLSSGLSEATEEGIQEYISALNNKLTLGQDIDLKETTKNAGYSALVGGLTGSAINTPGAIRNSKISNNVDALNLNQQVNEVRNQDIANASNNFNLGKNTQINEIKNSDISVNPSKLNMFKKIYKNAFDENGKFKSFKQQFHDYLNNKTYKGEKLIVLPNNKGLEYANIQDTPVEITEHAMNKHGIPKEIIENLDNELKNSVLALDSTTVPNARVVVLNEYDSEGSPYIAAIHQKNNKVDIEINRLSSLHEKASIQDFIDDTVSKGGKLYPNEKTNDWLSFNRLQLPEENTSTLVNNKNIPQTNQNVNLDISNNSNMQQNQNNSQNDILYANKENNVLKLSTKENIVNNFQQAKSGNIDNRQLRSWVNTSNVATGNENTISKADIDKITYEVQSNKKTHEKALNNIKDLNYESKVFRASDKLNSNKKITAVDIAEAQLALREAATRGDINSYLNLQQDIAIMGTELGQATQALSMIQKMSPDGQLAMLNKIVNRQQKLGNKNWENIELDNNIVQEVLDSYDDDTHTTFNKEKMDIAVDKLKQNIADQIKTTRAEKINEWRYLSMLGNPKTHIRNIVANVAMSGVKTIKDTFNATGQDLFIRNKENKTTTLKAPSKDVKQYAKELTKQTYSGEQTNKYNEKNEIESKKRIFKAKPLETIREFNAKALDYEDQIFKEKNFKKSFEKYVTSQGIKTSEDIRTNPEIIEQAKIFAMEEAKIATFQQDNELANWINSLDNKGPAAKVVRGAIIPFTRTPLNIAKTGIEYTPGAGLLKTVSDVRKAPKNMKGNVAIDGISKQVTGTSLALLGYALAKSGLVTANTGDDKDDKLETDQGMKMGYSIKLGNTSYDLSWLSPSTMPFFVGATMYEQLEKIDGWNGNVVMEALAGTIDPLSEMSCISSFTDVLKSYSNGDGEMISNAGKSTAQNYLSQFIPTVVSQFARVFDDTKRSTYADKNSKFTFGEETKRQLMYKIPGLRNMLPEQTDYLGESKKENENAFIRAFESFLSPANTKTDKSNKTTKELLKLYKETGEAGILPSKLDQYIKYGNEKYDLSQKEYNKLKKDYGTRAYEEIQNAINSDDYNALSKDEKAEVISNIMKYSKYKAKQNYFDEKGIDYSNTIFSKANKAEDSGYAIADYYITKQYTKTKKSTTSDRNRYQELAEKGIDGKTFDEFKYFISNVRADKDSNGNSIRGSKKQKIFDYINNLPLSATAKQNLYDDYNDNQGMFTYYK